MAKRSNRDSTGILDMLNQLGTMRLPNFLQQECTSRTAGKGARKPQSELNAALRNRGGAQAQLRAPRKAQSRGRSRPAEAEKKASKERRPSWAPNAAVLAEQVSEIWSRGVEGVKDTMEGVRDTWRPVREAHTSESAFQRLQRRLDDWFKTLEDCTGSPRTGPRLSSNLLRVNGGQGTAHLEVALAWRGIEIKLCLGPSSRDPEFAIMKAWTECNLADAAEDVHRAARQCYHEPVEAFMEALMPVNDPTPEGQPEDEDDLQEPRRSFASWLDQRPSMHRLRKASESLAWDVPLTRDDKTELLIQHLMAQEGQNHEEIEELQQAQVDPSRRSSRRWSRASRASSGGWSPRSP